MSLRNIVSSPTHLLLSREEKISFQIPRHGDFVENPVRPSLRSSNLVCEERVKFFLISFRFSTLKLVLLFLASPSLLLVLSNEKGGIWSKV